MSTLSSSRLNTTALAFIGDAVYELYARKRVIESGQTNADKLHQMAVKYVRAEGQARALKSMLDLLSEEERELVKRARNKKSASKPKNADPIEYKLATAFEALIGYLYIAGDTDRMENIMALAITEIDRVK